MSGYAKFKKHILTKKKKLEEYEIVALNVECSVVLQKAITTKVEGSTEIHHSLFLWNRIFQ